MRKRTQAMTVLALALVASATLWHAEAQQPLCINGHPAPRREHVTYGDKPAVHGLVRDHRVPLGLGGPDTADNVQYQTPADAEAKDGIEWAAIEAYCRGEVSLEGARALVAGWRR